MGNYNRRTYLKELKLARKGLFKVHRVASGLGVEDEINRIEDKILDEIEHTKKITNEEFKKEFGIR